MAQATSKPKRATPKFSLPQPSLFVQIIFNGVIPIVLFTVTYLIFSSRSSTANFEQLIQSSARQVAISIGSTIKRENFSELGQQLASLTEQPNIAFIYVRSEVADEWRVKSELQSRFDKSIIKALYAYANPRGEQGLRWSDDSSSYQQLANFYAGGFNNQLPPAIASSFSAQTGSLQGRSLNAFQIEQVGVYETAAGRTYGPAVPGQADFIIMVGMLINQNLSTIGDQNRNLLLAGVLFSVLSALFSILLARAISRPILKLIQTADELSLGNLKTPIRATGGQELSRLAEALERVRISLNLLIDRAKTSRGSTPPEDRKHA